ncbi:MAG: GntR family transcriptional regulator [Paracoccaceae bacterium]
MERDLNSIAKLVAPSAWRQPNGGPRYIQLGRHLARAINDGVLGADSSLPSEREMAEMTQLSRVTIRKAIEILVNENLVVQRHGSGTFVMPRVQKLEHSLSRLTSFTEDMQRRGKSSSSDVLSAGFFGPSPEEIVTLGLRSGDQVVRIVRLRRADGVPLAIEHSSLPPDILPNPKDVSTSLYEVLDRRGVRPVRAIQRISATKLTAEQAEHLGAEVSDPALKIARTGYLHSGRVIEYSTGTYRGDAYDFVAELQV